MSLTHDAPKPLLWVGTAKKKKSTSGISTPKPDMDLVRDRLKAALAHAGL